MELFSLAAACLFFLVCLAGGLFYAVVIARGRKRLLGFVIVAIGFPALLPLLMIVPPPNATLLSLSGTYVGTFGGGRTVFVLKPNGTFDQSCTEDRERKYINHGTWSVVSGRIDFDHILVTTDITGFPMMPKIGSFAGASPRWVGGAIYFNEDAEICVKRIK